MIMIFKNCIKISKTFYLTAVISLFATATFGQGRTAREQTILNVFGRLNLADDPYDDLFKWTDGDAFYRPFFFDLSTFETTPRANGDTIYFYGGTTHEGGYGMNVLLAADGKMTVADEDWRYKKGDRVEYRIVNSEKLLIISDVRTGVVKDVLKKFEGQLYDRYIDYIYQYILAGKYKRMEGSSETVVFNRDKSVVSGLISKGETPYTLFDDFGDTPIPILCFSKDMAYKATRILIGIELFPIQFGPEDVGEWMVDDSQPTITLIKTAEGQSGLPPGRFPLVSKNVMTMAELAIYAGEPKLLNLKVMRNEIFARYGYKFKTADMADFFGTQDWYMPQYDDVTSKLTEIELINIALIQVLEKNINR